MIHGHEPQRHVFTAKFTTSLNWRLEMLAAGSIHGDDALGKSPVERLGRQLCGHGGLVRQRDGLQEQLHGALRRELDRVGSK